jgi:hypothetical protein
MTLDQYYDCVDQLLGTQIDTYVLCIGSTSYREMGGRDPGEKVEHPNSVVEWRVKNNFNHLKSLGINPRTELIRYAKEKGFETIASLRMSDAHFAYSTTGPWSSHSTSQLMCTSSQFWRDHPECRIDPSFKKDGALGADWSRVVYDFSHPLIQQLVFDIVDDTFRHCDPEGFELDFTRQPPFFKEEEAIKKSDIMTNLVRRIKKIIDRISEERNHPISLGALVAATPEEGLRLGLDGLKWVREELLDYIVPKQIHQFNSDLPIEEYIQAVSDSNSKTQVYACLEDWPTGERRKHALEIFRGTAAHYWDIGVNGIYLYNYFCNTPHPFSGEARHIIQEIGDPEIIKRKNKRFVMTDYGRGWKYGEIKHPQLPIHLTEKHIINFVLSDDVCAAKRDNALDKVTLRLGLHNFVIEEDKIEYNLNNYIIPLERFQTSLDYKNQGFQWIECDLMNDPVPQQGVNKLQLYLKHRCTLLSNVPLSLKELEIVIQYR